MLTFDLHFQEEWEQGLPLKLFLKYILSIFHLMFQH